LPDTDLISDEGVPAIAEPKDNRSEVVERYGSVWVLDGRFVNCGGRRRMACEKLM
jgi:hypothetical protein